jgi:thioredoxin reductase (NADPH)
MKELYDLIIIGSGSAGLAAGIYAGRARLKTLIIERDKPGGQIRITSEVENYPGILNISGEELGLNMRKQAEKFGVSFKHGVVESVDFYSDIKKVRTVDAEYEALAVIIATGTVPRRIGFKGENEFRGRGIGYCATCDGEFFTGMDVFVIGAGFAAAEESIFLTRYARKVTIIAREPEFTCSKMIAERVLAHPKIEVKFNTEIVEAGGDNVLRYAKFINNKTGETWTYEAKPGETFGIFVFAGYIPQTSEYAEHLRLDGNGYIVTDESMRTNIDGVYAAGDVRAKELRQLVTAVADGAIAATHAEKYIAMKKEKLGIKTEDAPETVHPAKVFFEEDLRGQLAPIFERFENKVKILAILDSQQEFSAEIKSFLEEFVSLTDKVELEVLEKGQDAEKEKLINATIFPTFAILRNDNSYTGIQFHGVPGGHEINSFILALYNVAGPGQSIGEDILSRINRIDRKVNLKIGVSLSCTFCPDVVAACQLMAAKNPNIETEMIDVARFPDFKNQYSIMSVPAVVVNDKDIVFGKKTIEQILEIIEKIN